MALKLHERKIKLIDASFPLTTENSYITVVEGREGLSQEPCYTIELWTEVKDFCAEAMENNGQMTIAFMQNKQNKSAEPITQIETHRIRVIITQFEQLFPRPSIQIPDGDGNELTFYCYKIYAIPEIFYGLKQSKQPFRMQKQNASVIDVVKEIFTPFLSVIEIDDSGVMQPLNKAAYNDNWIHWPMGQSQFEFLQSILAKAGIFYTIVWNETEKKFQFKLGNFTTAYSEATEERNLKITEPDIYDNNRLEAIDIISNNSFGQFREPLQSQANFECLDQTLSANDLSLITEETLFPSTLSLELKDGFLNKVGESRTKYPYYSCADGIENKAVVEDAFNVRITQQASSQYVLIGELGTLVHPGEIITLTKATGQTSSTENFPVNKFVVTAVEFLANTRNIIGGPEQAEQDILNVRVTLIPAGIIFAPQLTKLSLPPRQKAQVVDEQGTMSKPGSVVQENGGVYIKFVWEHYYQEGKRTFSDTSLNAKLYPVPVRTETGRLPVIGEQVWIESDINGNFYVSGFFSPIVGHVTDENKMQTVFQARSGLPITQKSEQPSNSIILDDNEENPVLTVHAPGDHNVNVEQALSIQGGKLIVNAKEIVLQGKTHFAEYKDPQARTAEPAQTQQQPQKTADSTRQQQQQTKAPDQTGTPTPIPNPVNNTQQPQQTPDPKQPERQQATQPAASEESPQQVDKTSQEHQQARNAAAETQSKADTAKKKADDLQNAANEKQAAVEKAVGDAKQKAQEQAQKAQQAADAAKAEAQKVQDAANAAQQKIADAQAAQQRAQQIQQQAEAARKLAQDPGAIQDMAKQKAMQQGQAAAGQAESTARNAAENAARNAV